MKRTQLKIDLKNIMFFIIDFFRLCNRFCINFGSQKSFKNHKISKQIEVGRRPLKHCSFGTAFWMDFEALGG